MALRRLFGCEQVLYKAEALAGGGLYMLGELERSTAAKSPVQRINNSGGEEGAEYRIISLVGITAVGMHYI